ncbi:MAG: hypothetical protein IJU63_02855 [Bacteroidales bacterium]|nr:hypothetical protein [Bacteroidales bacterium]
MIRPRHIFLLVLLVLGFQFPLAAQFRTEAFSQSYNDDTPQPGDTADVLFSFKEYFGGLAHKNDLKIGTLAAGSAIFVGGCQIYNKQYWKLPIIYGGIAAGIYGGIHFNKQYQQSLSVEGGTPDTRAQSLSALCYIGAGLSYWGAMMDGVVSYRPNVFPQPGRATLYSLLVPGLGQAYNGEFWKVPIYIGGIVGSVHYYLVNKSNYERYRRIYIEANDPDIPYTGPIPAQTALYYRDVFRRYRDYSVLAIAAFYLLQVIDANVFSYMHDFEMSDDLSLRVSPALIVPETQYALQYAPAVPNAFGLRVGLNF